MSKKRGKNKYRVRNGEAYLEESDKIKIWRRAPDNGSFRVIIPGEQARERKCKIHYLTEAGKKRSVQLYLDMVVMRAHNWVPVFQKVQCEESGFEVYLLFWKICVKGQVFEPAKKRDYHLDYPVKLARKALQLEL